MACQLRNWGGISTKLTAVLSRLDTSLGQLDLPQINAGVTNLLVAARRALENAQALLARIEGRVDPLANNLTNTLFEAQKLF